MALLRWRHGKSSSSEAVAVLRDELRRMGHDGKVSWNGNRFSSSVGPFGTLFKGSGEVTSTEVVVQTCGGALGGTVMSQGKDMLHRLFPGGEVG